jgi:hypothetical protein
MALARCLREPQATTHIVTTDFNPLGKTHKKKASQLLERLFVVPPGHKPLYLIKSF